jgi:fibrillarin-like pre-rRNA processing protein
MAVDSVFPGVFRQGGRLLTENLTPGKRAYGEKLILDEGKEYREWDPFRSKLAASIRKGLQSLPIIPGCDVLYLGASTGTTPSHVSDIVGPDGLVYCVEISPTSMRSLLELSEKRENIIPILGDARQPAQYSEVGEVDVIYQDVAQPDQSDILIKNAKAYLKDGGLAMYCVKSQSIDVLKPTKEVFENVRAELKPFFDIVQEMPLEPYDKDHLFLSLRKK